MHLFLPNMKMVAAAIAEIFASVVMASCGTVHTSIVSDTNTETSAPSGVHDNAEYKDGVYTAIGQYGNLPSSITVTVTLDDDVITDVKVTPHATDPTSLDLQRRFAKAVPAVVVGKRIDEVKVDRLAGSSGTPIGFNAAIEQIKEQAEEAR